MIDPASLQVDRRARRAKTDRLDLEQLLASLIRHHRGERVWRTLKVPTESEEDARRRHRERGRLLHEATSLNNRIRGLLMTQNIRIKSCFGLADKLDSLRRWDGSCLPPTLTAEVRRMCERWDFVRAQLRELEKEIKLELTDGSKASEQARTLGTLRGVGEESALVLAKELFAWRDIRNRRQLGALAGMVSVPYSSGFSERDQGISKAGNRRERFGRGKRTRRVGIVALARKLLIKFWQFVEYGVVPDGALLKPAN